ncbi:MAG TPA: hypothetical protein EYH03_02985 [Chromatiales bacterium]|nr:hypothetical protein [Chromatiales bacterium]
MKTAFGILALFSFSAVAGEADIIDAKIISRGENRYDFQVTVEHADDGWEHYADRWEILTPSGEMLATRVLHHPHVQEQPFTRGLSGIEIPPSITSVTLRGYDKLHGYGGKTLTLQLPD